MTIENGTIVFVDDYQGISGTGVVTGRHPTDTMLAVEFKNSDDVYYYGQKMRAPIGYPLHNCHGACIAGWWVTPNRLKIVSCRLKNLIKSHAKKHDLKVFGA